MTTPSFKEDHISQIPALQLLINLGYKYLSPEEALNERQGKSSNVLLENILESQLCAINEFNFKGATRKFANKNITAAIDAIKNIQFDGLVRTNEKIYDLLSLGKSFEENIQGNFKSFNLNYIDWKNPLKNIFHVTEEFEVERIKSYEHRRPDLVLFVNGIPFAIIECKRPDLKYPITQAISQQIRNQKEDEIPHLFIYAQILMALSKNEAKYATVGSPEQFWFTWKERKDINSPLNEFINKPLDNEQKNKLFQSRYKYVRNYFDSIEQKGRQITEQDKAIYSLLKPERFIELARQFIVYDAGDKKIARYQQYYAVKKTIERVKNFSEPEKRKGGVIWHTQGSGKSLTMVMLAKAIAIDPDIENPRVVIVTDRIDLDDQIFNTFKHCGLEPYQATSGMDLLEQLQKSKKQILTTVLKKFESGLNARSTKINDPNIFTLVDESHRSQYGIANAKMNKIMPNACYIGFTGTPLLKPEKNTAFKFGGFIDKYTIDQAVEDKAVVPLLYEGRQVLQNVNKKPIDTWFERVCKPLSEAQRADLKRKFSRIDQLNVSDQTIFAVAYDISEHYKKNWQGTGYKAQIATQSKESALKYKTYLDEIGMVSSEVVISSPDDREGNEDIYEVNSSTIQAFWKKMLQKFGSEKEYNRQIIAAFNRPDNPEILIVVEKLLTGFDAPRNTILYIAKKLKEHTLLQAVARVNRVFEGKDYGYIVDYFGILGELDKALADYSALENFDPSDLEGTLTNINEEIKTLPQKHSELWDIFKEIKNKKDEEEYEQLLFNEELRIKFYTKLNAFSKTFGISLSVANFYDTVSNNQIEKYKTDLRFFQNLRSAVRQRYAETIDFKEYEAKIKKLLDTYVTSDEVIQITNLVNIMDKENFEKEVARIEGFAARADLIAHRTKRTIEEKFGEDPAFYEKFSKLIEQAIKDYRDKRINESEYFHRVNDYKEAVRQRKDNDSPAILDERDTARAFYGVITETVKSKSAEDNNAITDKIAEISIDIDDIILKNKIVDWYLNTDIQNKMFNQIEDYLLANVDIKFSYDDIDLIMEKVIDIAKKHYSS